MLKFIRKISKLISGIKVGVSIKKSKVVTHLE